MASGKWNDRLIGRERIKEYALMLLGTTRYSDEQISKHVQILLKMLNEQVEKCKVDGIRRARLRDGETPLDQEIEGLTEEARRRIVQRREQYEVLKTPDWKQRLSQWLHAKQQGNDHV